MALVSLKCPSCGGNIQMDDAKEKGFCMYCGSLLVMPERQVISHHNEVNASNIVCPHCHQANPANNMFCTNCRKNMKHTADNQNLSGIGMLGRVLGWFLWPVGVIIYVILIMLIGQAITGIGLAIGLPFDNDIADMIIFGLVAFAIPIIIAVLFARDWSKKK